MIFHAGERVDFIPLTSSAPETAVFQLTDGRGELVLLPLTVANGGLVQRRKGALHPIFIAPAQTGRYSYKFWDRDQVTSGAIRVIASPPVGPAPVEPERTMRYTGPGSDAR